MDIKLVPETVNYISFASKFILNHLYLSIICIIYLESSTKVFSRTRTFYIDENWFSSKTINIRVDFI